MSEHTPGPWAAKWSKYDEGTFIVQAGMPSNRVLAKFDGDGDGPDDQSIADARLIAAAPDLKDALTDVRDNGLIYWEPNTQRGHDQKAKMLSRIEACLAKADGRAQIAHVNNSYQTASTVNET